MPGRARQYRPETSMVRRGSTVRVRQRALGNPNTSGTGHRPFAAQRGRLRIVRAALARDPTGARTARRVISSGPGLARFDRLTQAKIVAVGCDQLPESFHGKEGVDGSSPSEGSAKAPHVGAFLFRSTCSRVNVRWGAVYGAFKLE